MKITTSPIPMNFQFDASRAQAKYSINGGASWMNHGEFCERIAKAILGYAPTKDAVAFDEGYDLPELKASIKSVRCGLTERKDMPRNPVDFMREFWAREIAERYIYVCDHGDYMTLYTMNPREFREFVSEFARWDAYCVKFRINTCDSKVERWLMESFEVE